MSRQEVDRALGLAAARLNAELGADRYPFGFRLRSVLGDPLELRKIHVAMAGAAVIVLLIACANLANLMLARGAAKRREIALRFAIGADRRALIVQLLSESVLLASAGGLLGLLLTTWAVDVIAYKMPPYGPLVTVPPHMSWRVLVFGFFAAGTTLLLFGLLPALRTTDVDLTEPLKDASGAATGRVRRYSGIVVAEVALSMLLLMGGALLTRAVVRATRYDFGYDPRGLYQTSVGVSTAQAPADSAVRVIRSVVDRVRHVPGVRAAALIDEDAARELFGGAGDEAVGRAVKSGDVESPVPWIRVVGVARRAKVGGGSSVLGMSPSGYRRPWCTSSVTDMPAAVASS